MFKSKFCEVSYNEEYNVVFVKWKKFCMLEDYREPLRYALQIIASHDGCNYVADTRDGFENDPQDTKWVAEYFIPQAVENGSKYIFFIIDKENRLEDELKQQEDDSYDKISFKYIYDLSEINSIVS